MLVVLLQGFTLDYSRTQTLHTRKVIGDALIGVIEARRRGTTEWNVQVVLESPVRKKLATKRHCRVRNEGRISKSS
jgi:hypothetical protein